jgi:hypothetical protein
MPKTNPEVVYILCTTEGCPCIEEWPGECDPSMTKLHEPKCKGPIQVGDPGNPYFYGFIYKDTCTCPSSPNDDVCWGCYLDSK